MTVSRTTRVRGAAFAIVAFAAGAACAYPLEAQQPPATTSAPAAGSPAGEIAAYRAPAIALVQPQPGGTVAQDRPALVFRFAQGEPDDPVDVASFAVTIAGKDRTKAFQLTATQAWGALGEAPAVGLHEVTARICSTRGACAVTQASVAVLPPPDGAEATTSRKRKARDALLDIGKRLLRP